MCYITFTQKMFSLTFLAGIEYVCTKYLGYYLEVPKGQLISECLFEKIVWTKIPTKNLIDSAQQV